MPCDKPGYNRRFSFNPIGYGLFQYCVPPMLNHSEGYEATVEGMHINSQNPKIEPPSIKTLDLRVKNCFDLRVGNAIFAKNHAKIQKNV